MSRRTTFFTALACLMISAGSLWAAGPTYIKDNITIHAIWNKEGSPYIVQRTIVVARGAVLYIQPGVEVRMQAPLAAAGQKAKQGHFLVVRGGLKAEGTAEETISFLPVATGGQWGGIYFEGCDSAQSVLKRCVIQGGRVACKGCSPLITESVISGSKRGIDVVSDAKPQITGNRITSNQFGLVLLSNTSSPEISQNLIYRNKYGLYFKDFGDPVIQYNDIYDNVAYDIVNISLKSLALPNNDFHLGDSTAIRKRIFDGSNKMGLGYVNVVPFEFKGVMETDAAAGSYTGPEEERAGTSTAPAAPLPAVNAARQPVTIVATIEATPVPQTLTMAKAPGDPERYVAPFSLSLDVLGQAVMTEPYQTGTRPRISVPAQSLMGFGGVVFADWRFIQPLSLGLGLQCTNLLGEKGWMQVSLDLGGRIYPFGPTMAGEFYLQGGVGLNLNRRAVDHYLPGNYHGYAGAGYRFFLDKDWGLDLGLQYDYITWHIKPNNGISLKAGWTWLLGK